MLDGNENLLRKEVILIKNKKTLFWLCIFIISAFLSTGCFPFNRSPVIESTPITTAKVGVAYTYEVNATDPNGDNLEFSLLIHPEGMTINSFTGVITWTPAVAGSYDVIVEVSDGNKSTIQSFTLTVEKALLTSIEVQPPSMNLTRGESESITSVTAYYDDGTDANVALNACTYESNKPTVVSVSSSGVIKVSLSCTTSTIAIITVRYTEGDVTKSDTVTVTVTSGGG